MSELQSGEAQARSVPAQDTIRFLRGRGLVPFPVCLPTSGTSCVQHGRCQSPGKVPLVKSWTRLEALPDHEAHVDQVVARWDGAVNVGVRTGHAFGLYVIDVDGTQGTEALAAYPELPNGPRVRTGQVGGHHYWFAPGDEVLTKKIAFLKKVDLIAEGGYVLAPGSSHRTGNQYAWEGDGIMVETWPTLPEWVSGVRGKSSVLDLPLADNDSVGIGQRAREFLANGAQEAQRDEALNAVVNLLGRGMDRDEVVRRVARALCELSPQLRPSDPWHEADVAAMVESIERQGGPRPAVALPESPELILDEEPTPAPTSITGKTAVSLVAALVEYQNSELAEPLIEGLINKGEFVWFFAPANAGKTIVAMDWACHVAAGRTYQGVRRVNAGKVLIIEQDREQDPMRYLETFFETGMWTAAELSENLYLAQRPDYALTSKDELLRFLAFIDEQAPVLVVVDAAYKFCLNDFQDASYKWVHAFKEAMVKRGIAVVMLDHSIANPEFTTSDGQARGDLDKLYGGSAKRKIVDTAIYMHGALKNGEVVLRWAKFQGAEKEPIRMSFSPVTGFTGHIKFDINKHTWTKAEKAIVEAISENGALDLAGLVRVTGLNERTIRRTLPDLVIREQIVRDGGGQGRGKKALYRLGPNAFGKQTTELVLDDERF